MTNEEKETIGRWLDNFDTVELGVHSGRAVTYETLARIKSKFDQYRSALEFYADKEKYVGPAGQMGLPDHMRLDLDSGEIAREALREG